MKNLEHKDMQNLSDSIEELKQLNALLVFMQTAYAEGAGTISEGETSDALYHIYTNQCNILKRMQGTLEDRVIA